MLYFTILLILAEGYLIGSISSAIIIGRLLTGEDIRTKGSGNAGATNTLRTLGKGAAAIVTLCDCLKAAVAILIAMLLSHLLAPELGKTAIYIAGVAAVLGHNFPVYFGFHGGKGILVSMVAMLFANWWIGLIVLVVALAIMAITKYVSLGSILGSILLVILSIILCHTDVAYIIFCIVIAALAIFMHRANIVRLMNGTENKLGRKKSKGAESDVKN